MEVVEKAVKELRHYSLNPPVRIKANAKLQQLMKSIEKLGIIQPLSITDKNIVVDGNRRLACAKLLKLKTVPCIVREFATKREMDELFESINTSMMKINSKQEVYIYERGGIISAKTLREIELIKAIGGVSFYKTYIVRKGGSPYTYALLIILYQRYAETSDRTAIRRMLRWAANVQGAHPTRMAMQEDVPLESLHKAIKQHKPLKKGWS